MTAFRTRRRDGRAPRPMLQPVPRTLCCPAPRSSSPSDGLSSLLALMLAPAEEPIDQIASTSRLRRRSADVGSDASSRGRCSRRRGRGRRRGITQMVAATLERAGLPIRPVEYMSVHILVGCRWVRCAAHHRADCSSCARRFGLRRRSDSVAPLPDRAAGRRSKSSCPTCSTSSPARCAPAGDSCRRSSSSSRRSLAPAASSARGPDRGALGLPVEDALERWPSGWTATTSLGGLRHRIQREVGGNLAEVLDVVATTMRDRAELAPRQRAHRGGPDSAVLLALPFLLSARSVLRESGATCRAHYELAARSCWMVIGLVLLLIGIVWLNGHEGGGVLTCSVHSWWALRSPPWRTRLLDLVFPRSAGQRTAPPLSEYEARRQRGRAAAPAVPRARGAARERWMAAVDRKPAPPAMSRASHAKL